METKETDGAGVLNRNKWNSLYRNLGSADRPPAEIDSVPPILGWGTEDLGKDYSYLLDFISPKNRAILDIGTGNGHVLGYLLLKFGNLTGIGFDVSDEAIKQGMKKVREYGLDERMTLMQRNMHEDWGLDEQQKFDVIMANYCLQFNTQKSFISVVMKVKSHLKPNGIFVGKVRSTSRSVPANYVKYGNESGTYVSGESHEQGMVYHHYCKDDIYEARDVLQGEIIRLDEVKDVREYDPYPIRAWYEFAIRHRACQG